MPRITTASVFVDDQAKALALYTDVLGFQPKTDVPVGEFRWLTVVSPDVPDGVELLLEPDEHPAAKPWARIGAIESAYEDMLALATAGRPEQSAGAGQAPPGR